MKRFTIILAALLLGVILIAPAQVNACLLLSGVGSCGNSGPHPFNTPVLVPQPSAYMNQNNPHGRTNVALRPNNGVAGAFEFPPITTNSTAMIIKGQVDLTLNSSSSNFEGLFTQNSGTFSITLSTNGVGTPSFFVQRNPTWFMTESSPAIFDFPSTVTGSGYAQGFYPVTASGNCFRNPSGVWQNAQAPATAAFFMTDMGFLCNGTPPPITGNLISIPGNGAQQPVGPNASPPQPATTCSFVGGQAQVTVHLAVAHNLTADQPYNLQGFTPGSYNAAYTVLPATTSLALVGTSPTVTTCPLITTEGTAFGGTGASITWPAQTAGAFSEGPTGIMTKNGQKFCALIVENGDDSNFQGSQAVSILDEKGIPLPGAPALSPWLNQGTATFSGTLTAASNLMAVTFTPIPITSATYIAASGSIPAKVSFGFGSSPGFMPGTEFTVIGTTSTGNVNLTYVADGSTTQASTTISGTPLTGVLGYPTALASPGAINVTSASTTTVIMPGMAVLGAPTAAVILPSAQTSSGGPGNYLLSVTQASSGSSGFGYNGHYYTAVSGGAGGGTISRKSQATLGDFYVTLGSTGVATSAPPGIGWGGSISDTMMLQGAFPVATSVSDPTEQAWAPSTSALAQLCKNATDIQSFTAAQTAAGNPMSVRSLYHLNDPGVWADSGEWSGTGYITGSGTTGTLNISTTKFGAFATQPTTPATQICGAGIPGSPLACPTITSGAGSTFALAWATAIGANVGSIGSPVAMSAGLWKPATPISSNLVNGYINTVSSKPTLHVTSMPTAGNVSFTGTLGNTLTAKIDNGAGASGNILTVTTSPGSVTVYAGLGPGQLLQGPGVTAGTHIVAQISSVGGTPGSTGTYTVDTPQLVASAVNMFATGPMPNAAASLMITGTPTGTITANMSVTDGNVNITGQPILLVGTGPVTNGNVTWIITPTYYPSFTADTGMFGTFVALTPGQYLQTPATPGVGVSSINTSIKIVDYGPNFKMSNGMTGDDYILSSAPAGGIGSAGSPVAINGTGISDGPAIAHGPALTIKEVGPGGVFPVLGISCTGYGVCTGGGSIKVSGTFDTAALNGMPSNLMGSVSLNAGGPPNTANCAPCDWTNLTGYTATLSSGTIWNWSGTLVNITPNIAPLFVSICAANGTPACNTNNGSAFAVMPSFVRVGVSTDTSGEGETGAAFTPQSGTVATYYKGGWGLVGWIGNNNQGGFLTGPPVAGTWTPSTTLMTAGDQYGIRVNGSAIAEGPQTYEQALSNALGGWPVTMLNATRDGIGSPPQALGGIDQTQTIGLGTGSATTFCSIAIYCSNVSPASTLFFNGATMTGATIANGVITNSPNQLTIPLGNQSSNVPITTGLVSGAVEPGLVLSATGLTTSPTLANCISGCDFTGYQATFDITHSPQQVWALNCPSGCTPGTYASMRAEPSSGPAPWSAYNWTGIAGILSANNAATFMVQLIMPGTFKVTVNGTQVCQDTNVFAWNNLGGNCTGTGVTGFVNYASGNFSVNITPPPANNAVILASWTNGMSPSGYVAPLINRPAVLDFFGNGNPTSGPVSSQFATTPGGGSIHVDGGDIADDGILTTQGYPVGAVGLSQYRSWYFGTKIPTTIPGQIAATPIVSVPSWRGVGSRDFLFLSGGGAIGANLMSQWAVDWATQSTFSGSISGGVLTLTSAATGPMWEGEVVDCVTVSGSCSAGPSAGIYILKLHTGSPAGWGANTSTYDLGGAGSTAITNQPLQNAVFYTGSGPIGFSGPMHDFPVQPAAFWDGTGYAPHSGSGAFASRRVMSRWAAQQWALIANDPTLASNPTLSRASGSTACPTNPSPCFDYSNTYAAHATPTSTTGVKATFNGLAANAIPIRVGTAVTCTGCAAGMSVVAVDHPPTQDVRAGQGQIGSLNNGFIVTMSATAPAGVAYTFGCSPNGGTGGSQCVNYVFKAGTTKGTFGTPFALSTCGENNLNGNATWGANPNGICKSNGIGSLVRDFRMGTTQNMWHGIQGTFGVGSPYDIGADPGANGAPFDQSSAFTCSIVDTLVVQCVKGNVYTAGNFVSIGKWVSGATYASYGDSALGTGFQGALIGYVGGQPFPITTPGSGQTTGQTTVRSITGTAPLTGTSSCASNVVTAHTAATNLVNGFASPTPSAFFLTGTGTLDGTYRSTGASTATTLVGTGTCTNGATSTTGNVDYGCGTGDNGLDGVFDLTVTGGVLTNAYPSSSILFSGIPIPMGIANGGFDNGQGVKTCLFTNTNGTPGVVTIATAPVDGVGGLGSTITDNNMMGDLLYDNTGFVGNPLNPFFTDNMGGYWEPGLPVTNFGGFLGVGVSG